MLCKWLTPIHRKFRAFLDWQGRIKKIQHKKEKEASIEQLSTFGRGGSGCCQGLIYCLLFRGNTGQRQKVTPWLQSWFYFAAQPLVLFFPNSYSPRARGTEGLCSGIQFCFTQTIKPLLPRKHDGATLNKYHTRNIGNIFLSLQTLKAFLGRCRLGCKGGKKPPLKQPKKQAKEMDEMRHASRNRRSSRRN